MFAIPSLAFDEIMSATEMVAGCKNIPRALVYLK